MKLYCHGRQLQNWQSSCSLFGIFNQFSADHSDMEHYTIECTVNFITAYIFCRGGGCLWNCITFVCTFFLDQESLQHLKTLIYAGKVHQLKASSISRHKLNYFKCTLITQNKHGTFYYCRLCIEHRLRQTAQSSEERTIVQYDLAKRQEISLTQINRESCLK